MFFHCNQSSTSIFLYNISSDVTPSVPSLASEETSCLKRVIQKHCYDADLPIPRVAHYVRFGAFEVPFGTFLSVLSVARFVKPCVVLFHGDVVPSGAYWKALTSLLPNLMHVQMKRPCQVFGHVIKQVEHSSDVARLKIMREYGGVYLDTDHLVLRSLDDLRQYPVVMGTETGTKLGNGFFLAEPEAEFLRLWQANYSDFKDSQWEEHSTIRPKRLSLDYPHLVNIVDTFFNPNYLRMPAMFSRKSVPRYDWSQHYGVHLYRRIKERLDQQDSVVGDMAKHVLFGDRHACWRSTKRKN
ncbi:hypothetical protein ACOMHN_038441 [Nucella lapillus]